MFKERERERVLVQGGVKLLVKDSKKILEGERERERERERETGAVGKYVSIRVQSLLEIKCIIN